MVSRPSVGCLSGRSLCHSHYLCCLYGIDLSCFASWQAGVRRRLLDPSSGMERHGSDMLERGGSTFSLESFDGGVHERRAPKSGAVGSIQSFASAVRRPLAGVLNSKARSLTWAGAELGMLAFFANAIMVGDADLS